MKTEKELNQLFDNLDKKEKRQRRVSIITFIAILILGLAWILFSISKVTALAKLAGELSNSINHKQDSISMLTSEILELKDTTITVYGEAIELPVKDMKGRQLYEMRLWVFSSLFNLNQIDSVVYDFDHSTFNLKSQTARNLTNGFAVSYRGWGCLNDLPVTVNKNDGSQQILSINSCELFGWQ